MNLRDQLLKAGLVDKKRAEQAAREKRQEEKKALSQQEDRDTRERREAAAREAGRAAKEAEVVAHRREADAREARELAERRPRQILRAKRIRFRPGPQPFWHRAPDGVQVWRLDLPEHLALDLRWGRVAVAWCDDAHPEVVLVDQETAQRIEQLRPELVLFRNRGGIDTAPDQQLHSREWEPDCERWLRRARR